MFLICLDFSALAAIYHSIFLSYLVGLRLTIHLWWCLFYLLRDSRSWYRQVTALPTAIGWWSAAGIYLVPYVWFFFNIDTADYITHNPK